MSQIDEDPRETRDDLGMMKRADLWPLWPYLPVKKPKWQTGVLIEDRNTKEALPTVFTRDGTIIVQFETLEELVADGWVVD